MSGDRVRRGVVAAQTVDPRLAARAREFRREMTAEERMLWQELRGGRLVGAKFRRQQMIGRHIADFYCNGAGLVVEVDGGIHSQRLEEDETRTKYFEQRGLTVLRFTNTQVRHTIDTVRANIATTLTTLLTPNNDTNTCTNTP